MKKTAYIFTLLGGLCLLIGGGCGKNDTASQNELEPTKFSITIENTSNKDPKQPLSPGVCIIENNGGGILSLSGELSPNSLESLAEYGSADEFFEYAKEQNGVIGVHKIEEPTLPGESTSFEITINEKSAYISCVHMAVASNDGLAISERVKMFDTDGVALESVSNAQNWDNGTEENQALGTGFEGGQPDPSRGEENISNGIATDPQQPVRRHTQLTSPIMRVTVTPQK